MKIAIITDSSAYINEADIRKFNIHVKPLKIIMNETTTFDDTFDNFKNNNLEEQIKNNFPIKTSMIPLGEIEEFYDQLLCEYDFIYHFPIAQNLSSMYESLLLLEGEEKFKNKVKIFKHYLAAGQLGEMVKTIANLVLNEKELSIEEVQKIIEKWENDCLTFFIPGDISRFSRSGRASSLLVTLLKILKTKVCILWKEKPQKFAFSPRVSKIVEKIISEMKSKFPKKEYVVLVYKPFFVDESDWDYKTIVNCFEKENYNVKKVIVPNVYVIHAGIKTLGISLIKKSMMA